MSASATRPTDDAPGRELDDALEAQWGRVYDPGTQRFISELPFRSDWRILDLGAGAGSMSYWLAERAADGSVVALDIDTSRLDGSRAANLSVVQQDVKTAEFDAQTFDLILARGVFSQLDRPREALRRAAGWLAPGGWMLVEDFYFLPSEHAATPAGRALIGAYLEGWRASGADMFWGRRLPVTLAEAGLGSVNVRATPMGPGQNAADNVLMRMRMRQQAPALIENGLVSAEDLKTFVDSLDDPRARDVTTLLFSVWGQRPAA